MKLVIVGSGLAGITLAEEVLKSNADTMITVITEESEGYYSRPMLSHGFSRDDIESKIILKSFEALRQQGIKVMAGCRATGIDRQKKTVAYLDGGQNLEINYDRLVLAPGSDAWIPPPLKPFENLLHVINSLHDLKELRAVRARILETGRPAQWAIVGGGLIGCEVASDLARSGDAVTLFHATSRLMERQLVAEDSNTLRMVLLSLGIKLHLEAVVTGIEPLGEQCALLLEEGRCEGFDGIISATGFIPRTALAQSAGLQVGRGILVNAWLASEDPSIYALGDAAECANGAIYAYVMPIRHQALWLAKHLTGQTDTPWEPPTFSPRAKVHGFTAAHAYRT